MIDRETGLVRPANITGVKSTCKTNNNIQANKMTMISKEIDQTSERELFFLAPIGSLSVTDSFSIANKASSILSPAAAVTVFLYS